MHAASTCMHVHMFLINKSSTGAFSFLSLPFEMWVCDWTQTETRSDSAIYQNSRWHKQKPLMTAPMKIIDWRAWVRWRVHHVTQAQLWNQEKREIMVSRLVEQHRAFTPLPLPLIWWACVVSLRLFPLWTLFSWIINPTHTFLCLSAPPMRAFLYNHTSLYCSYILVFSTATPSQTPLK